MLPRFINFLRTRRALAVANDATSARVRTTRIPKTPCCNGRGTTLYWIDSSGKHLRSDGRSLSQPLQAPAPRRRISQVPGILVVDDDIGMRALLNLVLSHQGFVVWLAGTGPQALELYRELHAEIDVVLLDMHMPGLDGLQTLAGLQRLNPEVQCCLMSPDTGTYTVEELLAQGAACVFHKPFHLTEVAHFLWQLAKNPSDLGAKRSKASDRRGST